MNDRELYEEIFPRLAAELSAAGEVMVYIDIVSQFSHYLMTHHRQIWQKTEQETSMDEEWRARFYLRP